MKTTHGVLIFHPFAFCRIGIFGQLGKTMFLINRLVTGGSFIKANSYRT